MRSRLKGDGSHAESDGHLTRDGTAGWNSNSVSSAPFPMANARISRTPANPEFRSETSTRSATVVPNAAAYRRRAGGHRRWRPAVPRGTSGCQVATTTRDHRLGSWAGAVNASTNGDSDSRSATTIWVENVP